MSHLDAALAWAARGHRVFPLQANSKTPIEQGWTTSATSEPDIIRAWWTDRLTSVERDHNVGVLTSDLAVIDIDVKNGRPGMETAERLGLKADSTLAVRTPSGGLHLYFRSDHPVGQSPLGPGVDVRGKNGYVLAPGSTIGGKAYAVEHDLPIAACPPELAAKLTTPRERARRGAGDLSFELDKPEALESATHWLRRDAPIAVQGQNGNDQTYRVACRVRDFGVSEHQALDLTLEHWNDRCDPPWAVQELSTIVENAYRYAKSEAGCASPESQFGSVAHVAIGQRPAPLITDHHGRSTNVLANVMAILRTRSKLDVFAFDEMARQPVILRALPAPALAGLDPNDSYPRPARDADVSRLQELIQHDGLPRLSRDLAHQAVDRRAEERGYHPVRDRLDALRWDHVPRLANWLATYLGAEASAYHAGIGAMFLISMAARLWEPGCQMDYVMVLEGPQGAGKSSACEILAGEWFSNSLPQLSDQKDVAQHLRGKWLVEIAELAAFRGAGMEHLKSFITRRVERYRPPYGKLDVVEPRQCVLVGTTNRSSYLRDETGGRRFWPVKVGRVDRALLVRDRDQLFAEAVVAYRRGDRWWPDAVFEAEHIQPQQEERFECDVWEETIAPYLSDRTRVQVTQVAREALHLTSDRVLTTDQRRITSILHRLGWHPIRDNQGRAYVPAGRP